MAAPQAMKAAVPDVAADPSAALALVLDAQRKLGQLDAVTKGLVDDLVTSAGQGPRLRELLATGEDLLAAVEAAANRLGATLPEGASLPPGPSQSVTDAVWAQQLRKEEEPTVLPTPVSQPAASLTELVAGLSQLPACTVQLLQGRQAAAEAAAASALLLHCGRAFVAVVQLQQPGSLLPLRVGILSPAEASAAARGADGGSLWASSRHAVFQKLTSLAVAALRHYSQQQAQQQQPQGDGTAAPSPLELLLLWLSTYSDLFSRRSSGSGSLLLADPAAGAELLPPLRRPLDLSWQELWQAALNPHLRHAEHLVDA